MFFQQFSIQLTVILGNNGFQPYWSKNPRTKLNGILVL